MSRPKKSTTEVLPAASSSLSIVARLSTHPARSGLAESVSTQLKTGIAIGLLRRGERLPNEEELARLFNVSLLTLRQALERLRHAGLLHTKTGRGGGSFISVTPAAMRALTQQALERVSLNYISALGLGAATMFAETARAAALRHNAFDRKILRNALQRLVSCQSPLDRKRAATMFIIDIASVARNERLLSGIIPMIGELQILTWHQIEVLPLGVNNDAQEVLTAITNSDPEAASRAARQMVRATTERILASKSSLDAVSDASEQEVCAEILGQFQNLMQRVYNIRTTLETVEAKLAGIPLPARAGKSDSEQTDSLLKNIVLDQPDNLIRGAGIAYAKGMFPGPDLAINWWDIGRDPRDGLNSLEFNRPSLQFYEHDRLPWFTKPLEKRGFCAYGPYVDRGGVEDLIVTVSIPIQAADYSGSVLAADLRIDEIEQVFFGRASTNSQRKFVILNEENRVVVSTTELLAPGMLADQSYLSKVDMASTAEDDCAEIGWRLVSFLPS